MEITIKWFEGKYPSFNLNLHSAPDRPEFLSIKGCRIMNGNTGPFVAYPSTKNETSGKYWNHCWGSEQFNAKVLELAIKTQPQQSAPQPARNAQGAQKTPPGDFEDDIPFAPINKRLLIAL